jgi:uncharacterized protein (DUF58 family)
VLTRSGLGAVVGSIVAIALGWWWGYEELVVVGVGLTCLVVLALWVSQRPLRARVRRRLTAPRVPRGDPINVVYRISNGSRFRSGRATIVDRCDDQTGEIVVDPIAAGDIVDLHTTIATRRRGVFPLGPLEVVRIDPFDLAVGRWRDERDDTDPPIVTVHPKVYDLSGPQGAIRVVEQEARLRRVATDPTAGFVSMREYVPGDDPRLIHWPTTARTGTLMVREHVEVRRPEFTVVLDAGADTGTADDFEEAVDVAATVAVHALRQNLDAIVRTTDAAHAGRPTPLFDDAEVLDLLTPVQQASGSALLTLPDLFVQGFDHTSIVMITGPLGPSSRFERIMNMTIVRVGAGAQATSGIALAVEDAPDFVRRWRTWA